MRTICVLALDKIILAQMFTFANIEEKHENKGMKDIVPPIISVICFVAFVYAGYFAGFWEIMNTWTWNTWAIFWLGVLVAWIGRNEFGGK